MDGARLVRLRWRLHGAWMWPTFIVLTLADGLLVHWLPLAGDSEQPLAGVLIGAFAGLAGIVLVGPLLGFALRRVRRDMPKVVARDYAGAIMIAGVSIVFLVVGVIHHPSIGADRRALEDAVARAEAYIGARAPDQFRRNLASADTFEIQAPLLYRTCVRNLGGTRSYCVVVDRAKPFGASVTAAGSEPNAVLAQGTR